MRSVSLPRIYKKPKSSLSLSTSGCTFMKKRWEEKRRAFLERWRWKNEWKKKGGWT